MHILPAITLLAAPLAAFALGGHKKLIATAHLHSPKNAPWGKIRAHFHFEGYTDGRPTKVKVHVLEGLKPTEELGGTNGFAYHIHTNPIGPDNDCAKTLAHLDPYNVTESIICDPAFPEYCQEGDLSGKHGKLNGTASGAIERFKYTDGYLRFFPEDVSILGRSIVIHAANKTRLACGNIISHLDGTAGFLGKPTGKPSDFVTKYPTVAPPNPPPTITPLVGTKFPTPAELEKFAHPLPLPATGLSKAANIKLTTITRKVKFTPEGATAPVEQEITSIKDEKVDEASPFGKRSKRRLSKHH